MDALKSLYDSQVSEDEAVEVLQCSQQYDEAIDLDEGAFRVVNVAPIDREAPRRIQDIVPGKLPDMLAVDLLNAFNAAPRQLSEEPEAPHATVTGVIQGCNLGMVHHGERGARPDSLESAQMAVIQAIAPAEGIAPDEERNVRPLYHRMVGRSRSRSAGQREPTDVYVPQLDVDNLPTRVHDPHRQCRLVPEGRPPKAIRGLRLDELATLIRRCGLEGAWRQGGKQSRAVFVGDKFIINQEKSSTWAQGVRAQEIDARLRAARRSGQ